MEQTENISSKHAICLADLREWHVVTATCFKCGYQGRLTAGYLAWERPPHTYLTELELDDLFVKKGRGACRAKRIAVYNYTLRYGRRWWTAVSSFSSEIIPKLTCLGKKNAC